jgi:hypothetical protein
MAKTFGSSAARETNSTTGSNESYGWCRRTVALADDGEDIFDLAQGRRDLGREGLVAELAPLVLGQDAHEVGDVERPRDAVDVERGLDVEGLAEAGDAGLDALAHADLDADGVAAVAPPELGLDGLEEVFGLFLIDLEVPVPGDAEGVGAAQARGRKNSLTCLAMRSSRRTKARLAPSTRTRIRRLSIVGTWMTPKPGSWAACSRENMTPRLMAFVAEVRERVAGVDGDGREDGEDVGAKALIEGGEVEGGELVGPDDDDACALEGRE